MYTGHILLSMVRSEEIKKVDICDDLVSKLMLNSLYSVFLETFDIILKIAFYCSLSCFLEVSII